MADTKVTALSARTNPSASDLLMIVHDPAGTPVSEKSTLQQVNDAVAAMVFIEEQTPTGTGTVTFSSLGSYSHLRIIVSGRSSESATATAIDCQFNGDTGANYDRQWVQGAGATASAQESIGQTAIKQILTLSGATAASGNIGSGEILIPNYRDTNLHKQGTSVFSVKTTNATGGSFSRANTWAWRSTSAITSITLALTAGNYVAGTKFSLYGIR